jgi:hypothetical protein
MIVYWKVRCFSRASKDFFDRNLVLDTTSLDPITRSRVEMCLEQRSSQEREILKYRQLFKEGGLPSPGSELRHDSGRIFGITDYFEDEDGKEITLTECARIKTGNENVVAFPSHYRPHDIALSLSDNSPIPENPQDHINLSQADIDALAYFVKDATELKENAFYSESPTLHSVGGVYTISTIPVEHIVSFVTIFRRLYMHKERGNYNNACAVYARHYLNKRLTHWITAERRLYNKFLAAKAKVIIMIGGEKSFTNRALIDTMLTVRFAHQPKENLRHQYEACLQETGDLPRLEWMFYHVIHEAALYYSRAHGIISNDLGWYLKRTGKSPTFDFAPYRNEMGRRDQLTAEQKREDALRRHAEKAGTALWEQAGCPEGQQERFIREAGERLRDEGAPPG